MKGNKNLNQFEIYNPLLTNEVVEKVKNMKTKTEKGFKLEDGSHEGTIKSIEYVERKSYEYVDIEIEEKESKLVLRYGVPFKVTENTALGQLIVRFGQKLDLETECDVHSDFIKYGDSIVMAKDDKVTFQTMMETTNKGTFAKIIIASLKPL